MQTQRKVHRLLSFVMTIAMLCAMMPVFTAPAEAAEQVSEISAVDTVEYDREEQITGDYKAELDSYNDGVSVYTESDYANAVQADEYAVAPSAAGLTLAELKAKFPAGAYWNGGDPDSYTWSPCVCHGRQSCGYADDCTCNGYTYDGDEYAWQCMGFAYKLQQDVYGGHPYDWTDNYDYASAMANLKPGDVVRYNGHSIFITYVNGDYIEYADCNSGVAGNCGIRWGAHNQTKSSIRSTFSYVTHAPYSLSGGTVVPETCTCSTSYAGTYVCTANSGLKIRSTHSTSGAQLGFIPSGATVTVTKGNGSWAHVTYGGVSGFASMQYLEKVEAGQERDSVVQLWFSDSIMGESSGTIRTGEWLYLCYKMFDANTGDNFDSYNSGSYTVKLTIYEPNGAVAHTYTYSGDADYIGVKRTTPGTYTGKLLFTYYNGATTEVGASIDMYYDPSVTVSSSDIRLNITGTNSQTINVSYSGATNSDSVSVRYEKSGSFFDCTWGEWSNHQIPLTITGVRAGTGTVTVKLIDGDTSEVLATTVVYVTVAAPTYTVSYNANGGSGAPGSQTKHYNTTLTLSSTRPTRAGYAFLGWSTSSTATSASYQPGGSFTRDANTTLYAVWKANPTVLSANTTNSAVITVGGEEKLYTFTPATSGTYVIYSTGSADTKVYLYNASGTELDSNDDSGDGNNFRLQYNLTAGAAYTFGVKYYNSSTTGTISFKFGNIYTVTYNANGGSGAPSSQSKDYGTNITLSSTQPTRTGYTFLGWSTSSTATSASYQPRGTFTGNANTTLYAVWKANPTALSANSTNSAVISVGGQEKLYTFTPTTSGKYVIYSTGSVDTLVYLYNANGTQLEYDDDDGDDRNFRLEYNLTAGTEYTFGVKYYSSSTTGTISFKFGKVYTVTYNANGGSGAPSAQSKDYGTGLTLSSIKPTRTGYTFLGWSTSSTATSASYQPGGSFTSNTNTTLYAVWKQGCENNAHTYTAGQYTDPTHPHKIYNTCVCGAKQDTGNTTTLSSCGDCPKANGTCGANLTWVLYNDGELVISGTGAMTDWLPSSNVPWYSYRSSIKKVTIESGVTSIGDWAFYNCFSLTSVTIGDRVKTIGEYAFYSCDSLISVTIPDSVTTIGRSAFSSCSELASVTIGDSVETIDFCAFYSCTSLTSMTIPSSVTSIDSGAFSFCNKLVSITVDANNAYYSSSADGVLFNKNKATLIHYPGGKSGTYTIPSSVTTIGPQAFTGCTSLMSVMIPSSVTTIAVQAFAICSALTSVTILSRNASFGSNVFSNTHADFTIHGYAGSTAETYASENGHTFVALSEPEIEKFDIFAANMTLGNELAMNFYFKQADLDGTDYYAVITKTYADGRDPVTKTVPYSEFAPFKNGSTMLWKISFNGIAAKEMADNITVQVFNGKDQAVSEVWNDSIRDYIMRNLDRTTFSAKQKVWAVECLNYGAASQTNFGYNTADLANNQMTDAHKALGLTSVSMSNNRVLGTNAKASNLSLESNISLSMYFTGITDPSTKYAIATFTDHNGNTKEGRIEGSAFKKNGSLYGVPVNMLVASDVRQLVTVTVYNVANNAVYGTCKDSVEGYAARMSNGNDLYSAVMRFGQASYNMFH